MLVDQRQDELASRRADNRNRMHFFLLVERLEIEVKLPNAQAGEPTMRYDYDKGEFFASNPKPQNQDIANLVNMNDDMQTITYLHVLIA